MTGSEKPEREGGAGPAGATKVTRVADVPTAIEAPRFTLVVERGGARVDTFEGGLDPIVVGSHPSNDVVIDDPTVSRIHLRIEPDAHGLRLVDLDSTNGTRVDGYRVGSLYLRDDSRIEIGDNALRVRFEGSRDVRALTADASFGPLVGGAPEMRRLYDRLRAAASTELPVLLEAETGAGKEMAARALHEASPRAEGPFVVFDAAAVSSTLLESELFGHERGAFTGATERHLGLAEEAAGGTLFLDEIGELPLELQSKLLRMLDNRELRRVGGSKTIALEARIVAATNRDLGAAVNQGSFRADLYYRLAVVRLVLPPLRDRREDIPLLVERFVKDAVRDSRHAGELLEGISETDWERLEQHAWPGNVRELRNVVHRMVALGDDPLPAPATPMRSADVAPGPANGDGAGLPALSLERPYIEQKRELVEAYERWYLNALMEQTDGNLSAAARLAGIDRMYFRRLLKKYL